MGQKNKGLYEKFYVSRNDLTDQIEGDKHFGCEYFVLDLTHDKHAIPAIKAYAESVRKDGYELLANDLLQKVDEFSNNTTQGVLEESASVANITDSSLGGTSLE